jgi:hypothetical protein
MITLSYSLAVEWRQPEPESWHAVDQMPLRYDYFLGDLIFVVDSADFSAKWG